MITREIARAHVITTLDGNAEGHDIEAILDELHDYLGHYNLDELQEVWHTPYEYWEVVQSHAYRVPAAVKAIITADAMIQEKEQEIRLLIQERAQAIQTAMQDGHTGEDIGKALNVEQPRVAHMLKQGK